MKPEMKTDAAVVKEVRRAALKRAIVLIDGLSFGLSDSQSPEEIAEHVISVAKQAIRAEAEK